MFQSYYYYTGTSFNFFDSLVTIAIETAFPDEANLIIAQYVFMKKIASINVSIETIKRKRKYLLKE